MLLHAKTYAFATQNLCFWKIKYVKIKENIEAIDNNLLIDNKI